VSLAYGDDALSVEVVDRCRGGDPATGGHGLVGMRERAGLHGGRVSAEPLSGGGFRVAAVLPTGDLA
jgi:signal transduction histidine kinase